MHSRVLFDENKMKRGQKTEKIVRKGYRIKKVRGNLRLFWPEILESLH